jgi:hypothetical protein
MGPASSSITRITSEISVFDSCLPLPSLNGLFSLEEDVFAEVLGDREEAARLVEDLALRMDIVRRTPDA